MQTHQIQVLGAREQVHEIRGELFAFPEVIEVFVTGRADSLVVVYAGRPRPGEWLCALRRLGYRTPSRSRAVASAMSAIQGNTTQRSTLQGRRSK